MLALLGLPANTQETGRPVRRAESVEGRKAEERRLDDTRRTEETRPEDKRVTKIDEVARKIDITKRQNPEFLDAERLSKEILADKRARDNEISVDVKRKTEKTLDRVAKGEVDPHLNDGAVFQNREGQLPQRESGYYREYVYRESGAPSPGAERIVVGKGGDVYYTGDHYNSFQKVK